MNSNMMSGVASGDRPANMMQQQEASGILSLASHLAKSVGDGKLDPAMAREAVKTGVMTELKEAFDAIEAQEVRLAAQNNQAMGMQIDPRTTVDKNNQGLAQLLGGNMAMGGQGPGIQQRGQMSAQPPQQPQQPPQQGIASQPAPNMAGLAGGGIVAFQKGGDVDAAKEYIRLSEKLKDPNIAPEAAQAITMTLEDMKRQAQDKPRFMLEIERARGFDPAAEYEQSMQSQGGMYGGGRVKGYAEGDQVTRTNDPEMYAIDDVLEDINAESRNAGQRIVWYDSQGNPITVEDLKKVTGMSEKESNYKTPGSERAQMSSTSPNMEDRILAMLQGMDNSDAPRNLNEAVGNIPIGGFTASLINSFLENPEGNTQEQVEPTRQGGIGGLEQNALIAESSAPQGSSSADQARQAEMAMYEQMNAQSQAQGLENMVNSGVDEADADARRSNANMDSAVSYSPVRPKAVPPRPAPQEPNRSGLEALLNITSNGTGQLSGEAIKALWQSQQGNTNNAPVQPTPQPTPEASYEWQGPREADARGPQPTPSGTNFAQENQDIVDAYQEAVMADRADTSRGVIVDPLTNFLGEEDAARQRKVNAAGGGEGKRKIDMRRLANVFAGMAGKTSNANAMAGAATADKIYREQQTADELKRDELKAQEARDKMVYEVGMGQNRDRPTDLRTQLKIDADELMRKNPLMTQTEANALSLKEYRANELGVALATLGVRQTGQATDTLMDMYVKWEEKQMGSLGAAGNVLPTDPTLTDMAAYLRYLNSEAGASELAIIQRAGGQTTTTASTTTDPTANAMAGVIDFENYEPTTPN